MKFAIITHVPHKVDDKSYFAYAPYVREMNIWGKYVKEFLIVGPIVKDSKTAIEITYNHKNIRFFKIESISLIGVKAILSVLYKAPKISWKIYKAMRQADHIHLRCPGNIGLLACLVQILFPSKAKTAKYAGNWDPKAVQPWSYRLQKWILSNTFLTRNMQVLVYGEWNGSSKNIKPFFTATYSEFYKETLIELDLKERINFVFVGTLVQGKNPLYGIQVVQQLLMKGYNIALDLYGEGIERNALEQYILSNHLQDSVKLKGNQSQETVAAAYKKSHFVILPSKSEGWPKVIAEGMFLGCIPVSTAVSCVPFMLDRGNRGILIEMNLQKDVRQLEIILANESEFKSMRIKASEWSREYTTDRFESEIKILLSS